MSDTPRTDALEFKAYGDDYPVVNSNVARELERELAAAQKEIALHKQLMASNVLLTRELYTELLQDRSRLDWLNEAIIGSFGPARASDDEHPVHTHSFEAPVYEQEQGGLRACIDAGMASEKGPS